ncbi:MAG: glucose 1-dehydrogenase [Oscillospiraceae bacterium]|nr:glucose 1-dehydrogenase [Oscillospiraceae bacterium]
MERIFDGRVALVTGAATGIGKSIAHLFASKGAKVVVSTRKNVTDGEAVAEEIRKAGGEATFIRCDVAIESEVEELVSKTVERYGRLDYAANNAGVGPDGKRLPIVPIAEYTEELWDAIMDPNVKGCMFCMKHEIRQMMKQGYGSIVNTSSVAHLVSNPGFAAYGASKSGVCKITQIAAAECATLGIRVNSIMPGPTKDTLLFDNITATDPDFGDVFAQVVPMKRMGLPLEMAETVVWLCSDAASFITGHNVPVDGGMTMNVIGD